MGLSGAGRVPVAALISGRGSNLRALLDAAANPRFPARFVAVISNVPGAGGLVHAETAGVPTSVIPHRDFGSREAFEAAVDARLREVGADLLCLAGFMRVLTPGFTRAWEGRMLNIHPSLLPAFPGLDTHARALAAGVRLHGCSVHFVTPDLDAGPIIAQAAVPVWPGDSAAGLAERVLEQEHRIFPLALSLVASGRARLEDGRAVVDADAWADGELVNPLG